MIHDKDDALVDGRGCDSLEIIQNKDYLIGIGCEIIEQGGKNDSNGRALWRHKQPLRFTAQVGIDRLERTNQICPEAQKLIILSVKC